MKKETFKRIYVEITNVCNLNCKFCKKTKRAPKFLTVDEFKIIISKIKYLTSHVYLHVVGEPLMHRDLQTLLDICAENNIRALITTNGVLVSKLKDTLIHPAIRQINYSLHSQSENDIFSKEYLNNIFDFIDYNKNNIFHCLRVWDFQSASENIAKNSYEILNLISERFGIEKKCDYFRKTKGHGIKLSENVYLQIEETFIWPDINGEKINSSGKCYGLKSHIAILSDGAIVPCCLDSDGEIQLGNIFTDDIGQVLLSSRAIKMKENFSQKKLIENLCETCGFIHKFFG